jgi:hypothetical protein
MVPQVPGTAALRDAIASLEGYANHKGKEFKPAVRVGGGDGVVWIDLGTKDWSAVKITAQGWEVVPQANVPFIRNSTMLPLPVPKSGGDIQELKQVLNCTASEFVLVVGWMLQALNPVGPYPLINPNGEAENGKTTLTRHIIELVDPSTIGVRKKDKVQDLLVAAKNNWLVAYDNVSTMSAEWADALSMLATGIGIGGRRFYTNDEEHSFVVERPVAFNGIPGDLTERADLASRTIKITVPPLKKRQTKGELERQFADVRPLVFGALCDGVSARSGELQRLM